MLLEGLAPDGGLYVPTDLPRLNLHPDMSYLEVAFEVLSALADDIPPEDLKVILANTYSSGLFPEEVVPVRRLHENLWLMKLSEGPTLAFKDVALQLVGQLMSYVLRQQGGELNILGATSGDTGSAAAHAVRLHHNLQLFMLSPKGRMSPFQQAQMYTLSEPNIHNLIIDGDFDACQRLVKEVNKDAAFKSDYYISAMNSINFARIAAQIVYYFWTCLQVGKVDNRPVTFSVPSGNFGNALAAHYAARMGAPIGQILIATNENDVLDELFTTGIYRPRKGKAPPTSSPSMDITEASNFERLAYEMGGGDPVMLRNWWQRLKTDGYIEFGDIDALIAETDGPPMASGRADEAMVIETIRFIYERFYQIIDPHTAVAMKIARDRHHWGAPFVIAETALPTKFEATIKEAIGDVPQRPDHLVGLEDKPWHVHELPADAAAIKAYIKANVS